MMKEYITRYMDCTHKKVFSVVTSAETPIEAHMKAGRKAGQKARNHKCGCYYWIDTFPREWAAQKVRRSRKKDRRNFYFVFLF